MLKTFCQCREYDIIIIIIIIIFIIIIIIISILLKNYKEDCLVSGFR